MDACVQDLEVQLQQEIGTAQDNIQSLEDSLAEEKQRRADVEQELLKQKQVCLHMCASLRWSAILCACHVIFIKVAFVSVKLLST